MQENTGKLVREEELEKLSKEKQKQYFKVPEKDIYTVQGMNRAERRRYAKEHRNKPKGVSDE